MRSLYIRDRERISFPFFLFRGHQLWLKEDSIPQWCRGGSGCTLGCWGCSCRRRPGPRPPQGPCVGQLASEAHQLAWRCALQRPHPVTPLQAQSWRDPSHTRRYRIGLEPGPCEPYPQATPRSLNKTLSGREGRREGRKEGMEGGGRRERERERGRERRQREKGRKDGGKKEKKEAENRIQDPL